MTFSRVTLEGTYVRLEPLADHHRAGLIEAVSDGELWKLFVTMVPSPEGIDAFLDTAQSLQREGDGVTFATIDKASNKVVGSTRFMHANLPHKRVEIGFTFIAKSFQKSRINTEAKLLMLTHAFETLQLNRVELLTDFLNHTSRTAILRLGANQEAILRSHMVMADGRVRDSVLFSITHYEWPGVRQNLRSKLDRQP